MGVEAVEKPIFRLFFDKIEPLTWSSSYAQIQAIQLQPNIDRMSTVEPVFANIGTNKGLKRFGLRGKAKVQGQWQLYCMIHNIEKIMRYGELAR